MRSSTTMISHSRDRSDRPRPRLSPTPPPQVSLAYDVDVSDAGMLGAGAYGTVLAAVHRSTGRQVAIKTMLKKYLLSDAEKASVEREIEIQKVRSSEHPKWDTSCVVARNSRLVCVIQDWCVVMWAPQIIVRAQ